jgi:cytochrome c peroxidase
MLAVRGAHSTRGASRTMTLPTHLLAPAFLAAALLRPVELPADTLPADFGATIPFGLTAEGFVDTPPPPLVFALGRELFFDGILSKDRSVSCATCHDPAEGFADRAPLPAGIRGQLAVRHAPSLFNRGFGRRFSWTGGAESLEAQMLLPIANGREMDLPLFDMVLRLKSDAHYAAKFGAAFEGGVTMTNVSVALAAFVSRIYCGDSAVDRFQGGDFKALDDRERAGLWVYESKGGCWRCHSGPNFSDEGFHDTGIGAQDGVPLAGRFDVTEDESDRGKFKTPTLRGVALTAPYMHDGSIATLEEVVAYYRHGARANKNLDPNLKPLELSDDDAAALVAFLRALSRPSSQAASATK